MDCCAGDWIARGASASVRGGSGDLAESERKVVFDVLRLSIIGVIVDSRLGDDTVTVVGSISGGLDIVVSGFVDSAWGSGLRIDGDQIMSAGAEDGPGVISPSGEMPARWPTAGGLSELERGEVISCSRSRGAVDGSSWSGDIGRFVNVVCFKTLSVWVRVKPLGGPPGPPRRFGAGRGNRSLSIFLKA